MSKEPEHQMGIIACMSYVIGCIIGSGIFITPVYVFDYTRKVAISLLIWVVAGAISLLGAVSYIELATGIPSDGCDYAYQHHVGWTAPAFCFMLVTCLFTYPGSTSVQAVTFGDYLIQGIEPYFPMESSLRAILQQAIAVFLLVFCSLLNFFPIEKFASKFQVVVTAAKIAVLSVIVAVGAYAFFAGGTNSINEPVEQRDANVGNYVMALYSGLWAFAGWDILNYGIPSVKNPRKTLPIALIGSLILVTFTYVLVNGAFFVVLGPQKVLDSKAIAADFAQASLGPFSVFVPFATAIMLLGSVNAEIFVSSRIIYEAARRGDLPPFAAAVHKETNSYRAALLLQMIVSVIMSFINVETLINYVSFVMWAQKLTTMVALMYIKRKNIAMDKNVMRVPIVVGITFLLILIGLIAIPVVTELAVTAVGIAILLSCLIFYFLFIRPTKLPKVLYTINDFISSATCRLLKSEIQTASEENKKRTEEEKPEVENPLLE